jgi:hypothetical protein
LEKVKSLRGRNSIFPDDNRSVVIGVQSNWEARPDRGRIGRSKHRNCRAHLNADHTAGSRCYEVRTYFISRFGPHIESICSQPVADSRDQVVFNSVALHRHLTRGRARLSVRTRQLSDIQLCGDTPPRVFDASNAGFVDRIVWGHGSLFDVLQGRVHNAAEFDSFSTDLHALVAEQGQRDVHCSPRQRFAEGGYPRAYSSAARGSNSNATQGSPPITQAS